MKTICIYHGNCTDGFTSAWVVWRWAKDKLLKGFEFFPGVYGNHPPDIIGKDVILVDFSYKRPVMEQIIREANSVLVLDHHKTAEEDLRDLPGAKVVFDMERSGAGITWDYFFPHIERPKVLSHVEDRDLWKFNLPFTREIQACLFSHPYDFEVWDRLMEANPEDLITEGKAIERKHRKDVAELVQVVTRKFKIRAPWMDGPAPSDLGFVEVPVANLPYTLTSDAGHLLCGDKYPFAGCYWDTPEGRVFSLRSKENGADVGEIAKQYGGGGHKHASGFRVSYDHELCN